MTQHFKPIKTDRLALRQLKESDWEMIRFLRSDPIVNQFVKRPQAETKAQALEFISKINKGIDNNTICYWVITEPDENQMMGSICLWNYSEDKKTVEVGYDLDPRHHGKGIMTESLARVIRFAFEELRFETIEAYTSKHNRNSIRLLQGSGFGLVEGKNDSHNSDNVVFEISNRN